MDLNWNSITVEQIDRINALKKTHTDDEFVYEVISYLFDVDAMDIPITQLKDYMAKLTFFQSNMPKAALKTEYELEGTKYKLLTNVAEMTTALYLDFTSYLKDNNTFENLLSVVLVPVGKSYNKGYNMEDARKDIRKMKCVDANAICSFFVESSNRFMLVILSYLQKLMKKEPSQQIQEIISHLESYPMF